MPSDLQLSQHSKEFLLKNYFISFHSAHNEDYGQKCMCMYVRACVYVVCVCVCVCVCVYIQIHTCIYLPVVIYIVYQKSLVWVSHTHHPHQYYMLSPVSSSQIT